MSLEQIQLSGRENILTPRTAEIKPWFLATLWRWLLMGSKSKIFEIILNFVFFEETQKHKVIKNLVFSVCWWLKLVVLDQLGIFYKCYD